MNGGASDHKDAPPAFQKLTVLMLNWRDTGHPDGGGSEVYAEEIVDGLAAAGHDVTMLTAAYPGAPPEQSRPSGARIVRRGGRLGVYLRAAIEYRRGHLGQPDVIVEVDNGVPFLARLWSGRVPVVVLVHHLHRKQWRVIFGPVRARIGWWLESRLAPRVNRGAQYVTVSERTKQELTTLGIAAARIEVIHNGTPAPLPEPIAKTTHPSLLVLGRLVPHKRIEIAVEVVAALSAEFDDLTLTIAGRGWWEPHLRDFVVRLGMSGHVTLEGFVTREERHRLYSSSWVNLVPSVKEGWGLVVVEAGIHGTPSVAFHGAGGVTESIIDGTTGLLADADDVEDFTAKVRSLLIDESMRRRLGDDARTYASKFTWDAAVKDFYQLLTETTESSFRK